MPNAALPCATKPDLWFSDSALEQTRAADRCVTECPIVDTCREWGKREEYGVWGGSLPNDPLRKAAVRQARREQREAERAAYAAEIHKLRADGFSYRDIGEQLGMSTSTVHNIVAAA